MLIVTVWDDFYMLDRSSDGENFGEHVFRDAGAQVSDIKMSAPRSIRRSSHAHWIHDLEDEGNETKVDNNRQCRVDRSVRERKDREERGERRKKKREDERYLETR